MKVLFFCVFFLLNLPTVFAYSTNSLLHAEENEAQATFHYFCQEVEKDATLSHEEQLAKIQEFKIVADSLSPQVSSHVTALLLEETRRRMCEMFYSAGLESNEIALYLADYEKVILNIRNLNVETARQVLFFVAELKIHRQYVYDFGIALGCPEKQLLRHDLCKLRGCEKIGRSTDF